MVIFESKVLNYIESHQLIEQQDRLLIACSGGIDSMGLLHFFIHCQHTLNIELFVAHVDHMLRGEVSAEDRAFVERFCLERDIPIFSTAIPIPKILKEEGGNSQAICRRERYAYFADVMEKHQINKLVTAHHADDQLESMLMSLTRAGTITGMKGILPKREFSSGTFIRPFLMVTKGEIREYIELNGGEFREDASNAKDDYTRNRFRHHIVPLLKMENENVSYNAVQLSENIQQDDNFLNDLAKNRFPHVIHKKDDNSFILEITAFQNEPVALQKRIILILLKYLYVDSNNHQSYNLCTSILELCKSQEGSATIDLPGQFVANRRYSKILFYKSKEQKEPTSAKLISFNEWTKLQEGKRLYIGEASTVVNEQQNNFIETYYFNSKGFSRPFKIRPRKEGDRISLKGMNDQKRLSRLFIDEKVPLQKRDYWPILVDSKDEVIAVIGLRVNKNVSKEKRLDDDLKILIEYENFN